MKRVRWNKKIVLLAAAWTLTALGMAAPPKTGEGGTPVQGAQAHLRGAPAHLQWRKIVVDPAFRSEGVAVADVNRDGKRDILVGDYWYQSPGGAQAPLRGAQAPLTWTRHEIRPPLTNLGDGAASYSEAFCCFAGDFNRDGWVDQLVIGFPGKPATWYENPRNKEGHWKARLAASSACNETPNWADLFGDGKPVLVMATQPEGQMCWFAPDADPEKPWTRHAVSPPSAAGERVPGTEVFSHGLGVGDVNGDKRADVIIPQGWWEQPRDARTTNAPWTFHPADLGEDCANMPALDVDGDRRPDVISSSAHRRGIWWHQQGRDGTFTPHLIFDAFTQTHALNVADINRDGRPDFVTGKRWWAHGPTGDVDPNAPPVLYWFEIARTEKGAPPRFVPHPIDDASGVGTQFATEDINGDGRLDVIVSNKRGVFVFEQVR